VTQNVLQISGTLWLRLKQLLRHPNHWRLNILLKAYTFYIWLSSCRVDEGNKSEDFCNRMLPYTRVKWNNKSNKVQFLNEMFIYSPSCFGLRAVIRDNTSVCGKSISSMNQTDQQTFFVFHISAFCCWRSYLNCFIDSNHIKMFYRFYLLFTFGLMCYSLENLTTDIGVIPEGSKHVGMYKKH
jgi:hypothetical protein